MRIACLIGLLWLAGCASGLTYRPAPQTPVDVARAVRVSAVYQPYELYFNALSYYDGSSVRMVLLTEMGTPLADLTVTSQDIFMHARQPQLPKRFLKEVARLARAKFFTPCPETEFTYHSAKSRGTFRVQTVQGDVCR